jgi:hypothetical protein
MFVTAMIANSFSLFNFLASKNTPKINGINAGYVYLNPLVIKLGVGPLGKKK